MAPRGETGLYAADYEHDACGVCFVARLDASAAARDRPACARRAREPRAPRRRRSRPEHGRRRRHPPADPDAFFRGVVGEALPPAGSYGVAMCFLPQDATRRARARVTAAGDRGGGGPGRRLLARRPRRPGARRRHRRRRGAVHPAADRRGGRRGSRSDQDAFERKLYVIRRRFELELGADAVVPSFSSRTIVYKGMLTAPQLRGYYPDLHDERTETALALVHSRFSTNTFPSWELAHPYRMIAHNGEINTLRGNINWMRARESQLASELFGDDLREGAARSCRRAAPTRPRSTTCSSCSSSPAARCRTR